jgi:hypothetical protein
MAFDGIIVFGVVSYESSLSWRGVGCENLERGK